eukprot:scaffold5297_cov374-Prasinococcus_capsulatus_cf.AAC.11
MELPHMLKDFHRTKPIPFREYSMLDNPRTPKHVKENMATIALCPDEACVHAYSKSKNSSAIRAHSTDIEAIQVSYSHW